jgi:hypothetical protein
MGQGLRNALQSVGGVSKGFPFGTRRSSHGYHPKNVRNAGVTKPSPDPFGTTEDRRERVTLHKIDQRMGPGV